MVDFKAHSAPTLCYGTI